MIFAAVLKLNLVAVAKAGLLGGMYHEENIPGRGIGCVADITIRWSSKNVVTVYVLSVKAIGPQLNETSVKSYVGPLRGPHKPAQNSEMIFYNFFGHRKGSLILREQPCLLMQVNLSSIPWYIFYGFHSFHKC